MKESWQNFSYGVVIVLIITLIYLSFTWLSNDPERSYFTLGSAIVLLVFTIEVFFSKRTDKKLNKIQSDVEWIREQSDKINKNESNTCKQNKKSESDKNCEPDYLDWSNKYTKKTTSYNQRMRIVYPILALVLALSLYAILPEKDRWVSVISAMSVVATIMVAETNNYYQNKNLQSASLFKVFEFLSNPTMRQTRKEIHEKYNELDGNNKTVIFEDISKEYPDKADLILSAFDQVSAMVLNGIIDEELFFDIYGKMIVVEYKTLLGDIKRRRDYNENTLRHFTALKIRFENRPDIGKVEPYYKKEGKKSQNEMTVDKEN